MTSSHLLAVYDGRDRASATVERDGPSTPSISPASAKNLFG